MDNYEFDKPVSERARLFGRDAEWKAITRLLGSPQGGLGLIIGGARSGKTSFLLTLDHELQEALKHQQSPMAISYYTNLQELAQTLTGLESDVEGPDTYLKYAAGMDGLLNQLGLNHPRYADALVYEQRLKENLGERKFGDPPELKAARAKIIDELNKFALATLNRSFKEFCEEMNSPVAPSAPNQDENRVRSARFCADLITGLREKARERLQVCGINEEQLLYSRQQTTKEYLYSVYPLVHEACAKKLEKGKSIKLVFLIDDADWLIRQPWWLDFVGAMQIMFAPDSPLRDLVILLAGERSLNQVYEEGILDRLTPNLNILHNLSLEAVASILQEALAPREVSAEIAAGVHRQTGGHPYLSKLFADRLIEATTLDLVAMKQIVRDLGQNRMVHQHFEGWNKSCGEDGRSIYRLLLESGTKLTWREIRQNTKLAESTRLDALLDLLCCHGLVTKTVGDEEDYYQVAGELFARWFRDAVGV